MDHLRHVPEYNKHVQTVMLVQSHRTAHLESEYVQLIGAGSVATFAGGPLGYMGVHEMA